MAAFAYVLPAYSILRRMVDLREELKLGNVQLKGTATVAAGDGASALGGAGDKDLQAEAVVSMKVPGRCRFEVRVPEGNTAASVYAGGKSAAQGAEIGALTEAVEQICPILGSRGGRDGVEQHLRRLGVDTKRSSLARFGSRIVYVIGSREEGKPQFWVYKDTFLPARVLYTENGAQWDVRFLDFGSPVAGNWFPRVVEVWKDGQPALKFTALEANGNARLDDALFGGGAASAR